MRNNGSWDSSVSPEQRKTKATFPLPFVFSAVRKCPFLTWSSFPWLSFAFFVITWSLVSKEPRWRCLEAEELEFLYYARDRHALSRTRLLGRAPTRVGVNLRFVLLRGACVQVSVCFPASAGFGSGYAIAKYRQAAL